MIRRRARWRRRVGLGGGYLEGVTWLLLAQDLFLILNDPERKSTVMKASLTWNVIVKVMINYRRNAHSFQTSRPLS